MAREVPLDGGSGTGPPRARPPRVRRDESALGRERSCVAADRAAGTCSRTPATSNADEEPREPTTQAIHHQFLTSSTRGCLLRGIVVALPPSFSSAGSPALVRNTTMALARAVATPLSTSVT